MALVALTLIVICPSAVFSKPTTPLGDKAYDGGRISAESLGRGGTFSSNRGSPASGSENPAALIHSLTSGIYATANVGVTSEAPSKNIELVDPIQGKVLQYLAFNGEKGSLFFEPLGRRNEEQITDPATPTTDYREVEFSADAIGFAGAAEMGPGSYGLSISYLHGMLAHTEHTTGNPDTSSLDSGNGVRLNLGFRYPTGPAMWGLTLQNFPGFLWWKDHKKEVLPIKFRFGNTYKIRPGMLFSIDVEKRYYNEGSNEEDWIYMGYEGLASESFSYSFGVFSDDISKPEERHYTLGVSAKSKSNISISYALEKYELDEKKVNQSTLSILFPFSGGFDDES